jgi:hypothetical protein
VPASTLLICQAAFQHTCCCRSPHQHTNTSRGATAAAKVRQQQQQLPVSSLHPVSLSQPASVQLGRPFSSRHDITCSSHVPPSHPPTPVLQSRQKCKIGRTACAPVTPSHARVLRGGSTALGYTPRLSTHNTQHSTNRLNCPHSCSCVCSFSRHTVHAHAYSTRCRCLFCKQQHI